MSAITFTAPPSASPWYRRRPRMYHAPVLAPLLVFLVSLTIIAFARPGPASIKHPEADLYLPDRGFYLDRPAGALLGAIGMVVCGAVSTSEAIHQAVNYDTLILLFGMMVVSAYMVEARLFRYVSW